ncbi:MAG: hypothetical protein B6244_08645 [Candidatus Cloacimonetes bacterium 4572_55]|nr:MAG: hypothetical protein B6244_08645 [Candidatus Cloacimonetes bacterium 4572_55]
MINLQQKKTEFFLGSGLSAFSYHIVSIKFIKNNISLLKYLIYPLIINSVAFLILFAVSFYLYDNWLDSIIHPSESWRYTLLYSAIIIISSILFLLFIFFSFSLLSSVIAAPFYDMLSQRTEEIALGVSLDEDFDWRIFLRDARNTIIEQIQRLLFFGAIWICVLPTLLIPVAGEIAITLVTLTFIGFEYLDLPLSRLRLRFPDKLRIFSRYKLTLLGFGAASGLLLAIPFVNIISIPLSVVGGTLLYCHRIRPEVLPKEKVDH